MAYRIPFGNPIIGNRAKKEILESVNKNWVSTGKKVEKFEREWGKLFDYKYNIAVGSGTNADIISCKALYEINSNRSTRLEDNQIIIPACAFSSVGSSVIDAGFLPVFVDVERDSININTNKIEEKINDKTRAIMVVHTNGVPCKIDEIMDIASGKKLTVIEDSCEAYGAKYKGKYVGKFGDMSVFSFFAAHLVYSGEGGMVSTESENIARVLGSLRDHGRREGTKYFDHIRLGSNYRMNDLEASIGLDYTSPDSFWKVFNKRKENLVYLLEKTKDLEEFCWFTKEDLNGSEMVVSPHAFSMTLKDERFDSERLKKFLADDGNGIDWKRSYGSMPTQHKAFEFLGHKFGEFPESEYIGENGIHFGIHQSITIKDLDYISERLHDYFKRY